jgi:hypothetical protein
MLQSKPYNRVMDMIMTSTGPVIYIPTFLLSEAPRSCIEHLPDLDLVAAKRPPVLVAVQFELRVAHSSF